MAWAVSKALVGALPEPGTARLRSIKDPQAGDLIDSGLVLTFGEGRSFTGEETVELHVHGSLAVQKRLLDSLAAQAGVRLAEAGEFTRRALENGRMDLAQVEGLADLISAETERQRKQALRLLAGDLGRRVQGWRERLVRASALIMAALDFSEEDVPDDVSRDVQAILEALTAAFEGELDRSKAAERVRGGVEIAIVGAPNVGKSTLLNYLAGRDVALTSEVAGTTRDVIEVRLDLSGVACTLLDTAGLRAAEDSVEAMGVSRARLRAAQADLRIFLTEERPDPTLYCEGDVVRRPKADLQGGSGPGISGLTGLGVDDLLREVSDRVRGMTRGDGLLATLRQQRALRLALERLRSAQENLSRGETAVDLVAEDLRAATRAVDALVGKVDVEDLLDDIFSQFCIGK